MPIVLKVLYGGLSWDQFNSQVLSNLGAYKGVWVQENCIPWRIPLFQRPQQIALALGRLGYLVVYKTCGLADRVVGVRKIAPNVWLMSDKNVGFINGAVHVFCSPMLNPPFERIEKRDASSWTVYDYIDHIDIDITGTTESVNDSIRLKDCMFNGKFDFVTATAGLLETEAVKAVGRNKVFLVPNGVDTHHYRNPVHKQARLPKVFLNFRKRHTNVVGYFGAIAPWLWYDELDKLIKGRKDIGFLFIGPDYGEVPCDVFQGDNVLRISAVKYQVLPAYARQFDVCFIPFKPGQIARTTSPLKLFEYFALEKPVVVTSEMYECLTFPEVFVGDCADTLSGAIDQAIARKSDVEFKRRLAQLADENSWDERARSLEPLFRQIDKSKPEE